MALIEDVFKGNLVAGLAVGVGAIIFGPTVIKTMGGILRPAAKSLIKGGMVFYRETLSEIGEMATDLVAEARAELDQEAGAGGGAGTSRYRLNEDALKQRADESLRRVLEDGFDQCSGYRAPESIHIATVGGCGGLRTAFRNIAQRPQLFPQIVN